MKLATMRTAGTTAAARIADDNAVETGNRDPGSLLADDGWKGARSRSRSRSRSRQPTAHGTTLRPLVYVERGLVRPHRRCERKAERFLHSRPLPPPSSGHRRLVCADGRQRSV
jgi:hypothetical protein